jgi:hypothetical protein
MRRRPKRLASVSVSRHLRCRTWRHPDSSAQNDAAGSGSVSRGEDHGSRFGAPAVRMPGQGSGKAARGTLPGPALAGARLVVLQRRPAVGDGRAAPGAARRVRNPGCGLGGDGGAHVPGGRTGAGAADGGMAQPVAGVAGVAARVDQPRLRGAHPVLPGPVPGRHPAPGPDGGGRAGHVHRGHPQRGDAGAAGERGDPAPHPRHAARRAQRRGPRGADQRQPGPLPGAAQGPPAPAAGLDAGADRALAARGLAAGRRRVDRRPDLAVPGPGARSPAVRAVPPDRAAPGCAAARPPAGTRSPP